MPSVPAVPLPSVAPTTSGTSYQSSAAATPQAFGSQVGEAYSRLGAQVEQTGDVLAKHAIKMQDEVNSASAKDMFLQADIEVGKLTVDYNQLEGINKVNAYDKYAQDVHAVREKYRQMAPNDDVARKFDQDFARRVGYSIIDGARGAASALKQYNHQTSTAVRQNTLSHIAANAQDDLKFESEVKTGLDTFKTNDEYRGSSPEVQEQKDREYVTAAWATRLQSMSDADPLRARDLLEKNKGKLDGGKVLQIQDHINQKIIAVDTRVSADKIIQSGALVPPDLKEAVKRFEGYSAKPYSDYKQTSSGYGTKAQPGDENLPPEQLKAIHEQRLDNELARAANIVDQFAPGLPSGTRNALISLTFNAGSAWTSAGLGQSVRAGDYEAAREKLLQYNKAGGEVNEALVARRATEATWFGGAPSTSDPTTKLTDAMDRAKERAIEVFPNDPGNQAKYLDALQSRIRSDNSVLETAARQMQLDMKNTVQRELVNDQSITSYDRLSPQAKQAYDLSPPSQQDVYKRQMRQNATADVPLTDERQKLYMSLYGEARNEPEKFMSRNITELDLPRAMKRELGKMQEDRKALLAKGERLSSLMSSMGPALKEAGITQSSSDTQKQQQYNRFSGMLDKAVGAFEEEKKRQASDAEVREIGNSLLRDVVLDPGIPYVPFTGTTKKAFELEVRKGSEAEDYARIPAGALFKHPDGTIRRKPL